MAKGKSKPSEKAEACQCSNCTHFNKEGSCRRYPPTASGNPLVRAVDWCGEHKPNLDGI